MEYNSIVSYNLSLYCVSLLYSQYQYHQIVQFKIIITLVVSSTMETLNKMQPSLTAPQLSKLYEHVLNHLQVLLRNNYRYRLVGLTPQQISSFKQVVLKWLNRPQQLFQASQNYTHSQSESSKRSINEPSIQIAHYQEKLRDYLTLQENKLKDSNCSDQSIKLVLKKKEEQSLKQLQRVVKDNVQKEKQIILKEDEINFFRIDAENHINHQIVKQQSTTQAYIQCHSDNDSEQENQLDLTKIHCKIAAQFQTVRHVTKKRRQQMQLIDVFAKFPHGEVYFKKGRATLATIDKQKVREWYQTA